MQKPKLTVNRPPVLAAAPAIDAHLFGSPPAVAAPSEPAEESAIATRVVFTNQLKPDLYVLLRQYEHHAEVELHEILDAALRAYFSDKPQAHQVLPPKAAAKLAEKLRRR